jgi:hypothetical protein
MATRGWFIMRACLHTIALVILLGATALAQELPDNALLVGHWDFDEGEGQWIADTSPFALSGFLGSRLDPDEDDPAWVAEGHAGGCLRFDGASDRVTVQHAAHLGPAEGIIAEAWVMQTERTDFARVMDKGLTFDIYIHANGTASFRLLGAEAHGVRSPEPIPLAEWVKIRGEVYGGTMRLIINDEVVAEREYTDEITDSHHDLRIGSAQTGRPFAGLIDSVKLWNVGWEPPAMMQAAEPDEHTVGLWRLDDLTASDASGNQPDPEVVNAQLTDGRSGKALRFFGDGFVRIPDNDSLDLTEQLCIDAWVHPQERSQFMRVVAKTDWMWGMWLDRTGHVDFFFKTDDGGWHHVVSMDEVPLRQWTHLRAEFDGFEAAVYINGSESVRNRMPAGAGTLQTSDGDLYIGNRHLADRGFIGMIDEVHISDVIRTERPPLVVAVDPLPSQGLWAVTANARGLETPPASIAGRIYTAEGREPMISFTIDEVPRGIGETLVEVGEMQPGEYTIAIDALDAGGGALADQQVQVTVPDAAEWAAAKAGVTDEVLPPWTPLEVEGETVSCWGRSHDFGGAGILDGLTSAEAQLLAGPYDLLADGSPVAWDDLVLVEAADDYVAMTRTGRALGLTLELGARLEFDGMCRFDLKVTPAAGADRPSELLLQVPLVAEHATLMHHPGKWFDDQTCAGAVPDEGWEAPDTVWLWAGDEDRGLCWFAEDQAAWELGPDLPGISLIPEGDRTVMRVWLANVAGKLDAPRSFTWGLMATPVKPMPDDWRTWRFGSPIHGTNVAVQWSRRGMSRWHSFPVPIEPEKYRELGDAAHAAGRRIVPYTNFNMQSDTGAAWDYFGAEWDAHAGRGTAADVLAMGIINMRCCPATESWTDFIAWKYQQFLEEYDWDGYYLDNSIPGRCKNTHHPEDHHNRTHIFACRELMKRFYAITKLDDPRNVMVCHMSTRLCIPVLSFCDAYVDGEQYHWALDTFDGNYMDLTTLERVRAELIGRNWGLIPLFLPELGGPSRRTPTRTRELLALLLPHETRFWLGACHLETLVAALDALDEFGMAESEFLPYWSNGEVVKPEGDDVIASAWQHPENGVLVIVSNFADEERALTVALHLDALGLPATPTATVMMDEGDASVTGQTLTVTVPARDFRLVRLER